MWRNIEVDLTGKRFGRLVVIEEASPPMYSKSGKKIKRWVCQCDCGNIHIVRHGSLQSGQTKSCGCLKKETDLLNIKKYNEENNYDANNLSYTRIYQIWTGMKKRCYNKNSHAYENYGGRGIKVCEEWNNDFNAFYKWSIDNCYNDDLSIDRIDCNGDYCPENCRWANDTEQARNNRRNVIIEYNGLKLHTWEWEEITGIPARIIRWRYYQGWKPEKILNQPVRKRHIS